MILFMNHRCYDTLQLWWNGKGHIEYKNGIKFSFYNYQQFLFHRPSPG